MIASLHDQNNHITIPGFYNDVEQLSATDRQALNDPTLWPYRIPKTLRHKRRLAKKLYHHRVSIRPTLDVNRISSRYAKEGAKTVSKSLRKNIDAISTQPTIRQNNWTFYQTLPTNCSSIGKNKSNTTPRRRGSHNTHQQHCLPAAVNAMTTTLAKPIPTAKVVAYPLLPYSKKP